MPFKSKKQWRWAFATHKSFAREWAHKSKPFKTLPKRKGSKAKRR